MHSTFFKCDAREEQNRKSTIEKRKMYSFVSLFVNGDKNKKLKSHAQLQSSIHHTEKKNKYDADDCLLNLVGVLNVVFLFCFFFVRFLFLRFFFLLFFLLLFFLLWFSSLFGSCTSSFIIKLQRSFGNIIRTGSLEIRFSHIRILFREADGCAFDVD